MSGKDDTKIPRDQFFELLWQQPMTKLAELWDIPKQDIPKLCDAYNIPRPPNGYWAQTNWGTAPDRPALPELDDEAVVELKRFRTAFDLGTEQPDTADEDVVAGAHRMKDTSAAAPVVVPEQLSNPHPVVKRLRFENQQSRPNARDVPGEPRAADTSISLSKQARPRALRILDAVFKYWESQGGEVSVRGGLGDGDDFVSFSISEERRRVEKKSPGHYWREWDYIFTGKLTLELECRYFEGLRRRWSDGKVQRLEHTLDHFLRPVPVYLTSIKQARLDEACRKRQAAKAEQRRLAATEEQEAEKKRREELHKSAENWESAQRIRAYLSALESTLADGKVRPSQPETFEAWFRWAQWYADALCPLTVAKERPGPPTGPENVPIPSLDLTSTTRSVLAGSDLETTDQLYSKTKAELRELYPERPWLVLEELEQVLEGLGYNMNAKKWTYRYGI